MTPPLIPASPLATSVASGSRTSTAAMASTPSRSLSSSRPRAATQDVAHRPGGQHAQRRAVGAQRERGRPTSTAKYAPPAPQAKNTSNGAHQP